MIPVHLRSRGGRRRVDVAVALLVLTTTLAFGPAGAASATSGDVQAFPVGATLEGTTKGTTLADTDTLPSCATVKGVSWYAVTAPRRGAMVARLSAGEGNSAALFVQRKVRAHLVESACAATNADGRATVAWYGYEKRTYLIGVGRPKAAAATGFELSVLAAEPQERPPGKPLPAGGVVRETIDPILDATDAWSVTMQRGTTYGIHAVSGSCVKLAIYRPNVSSFGTARPVESNGCGGFVAFTPGIDGGGTYSIVVHADGSKPVTRTYRLEAAAFGLDDGAPGLKLENGEIVQGSIAGRGVDVVDLYRISVPRENELATIELKQKPKVGLDLVLMTELGDQVACACTGTGRQVLREDLEPGSYFVAVRARGHSGGDYALLARIRDVTTTAITSGGAKSVEADWGRAVPLTVNVTSASHGGVVQIEIDRHDPLLGWQFLDVQKGALGSGGTYTLSWSPPSVGHWRARARFLGTPYSSFSSSGYVLVHVTEPLE
jgi:hypothetical protein